MEPVTFKNTAAQGDCFIKRVNSIPAVDMNKQEPDELGNLVAAHSETNHNHVLDPRHCNLFDQDEFTSWLEVPAGKTVIMRHLRDHDTHGPIEIGEGTYKITRQREHTPEGYRRAQD